MAIGDMFKRKAKVPAAGEATPRAASSPAAPAAPVLRARERRLVGIIVAPHRTEKTSRASAGGWYAFRVRRDASKVLVRQAVEDRYGVRVKLVRIVNQRSKAVRIGRITGRTPGFKKALVKLVQGEALELE